MGEPSLDGPIIRPRSRLHMPGTACTIRVRTLALLVSVGLHLLGIGLLALSRLAAPLPAPPPLVEVEFVEIAGARGGGGPSGVAQALPTSRTAAVPASPQAAALRDPAAPHVEPAPQQAATAATAATSGPATVTAGGAGSGGGTGGGQGAGAGQSVGSGTGQGGVAVDRMPVVVRRIRPAYPMDARRRGISGQVMLRLYVDASGEVREVHVQAAEPAGMFEEKAVEAARKWRFEPAVFKGVPVGVWMTLPVRFALDER